MPQPPHKWQSFQFLSFSVLLFFFISSSPPPTPDRVGSLALLLPLPSLRGPAGGGRPSSIDHVNALNRHRASASMKPPRGAGPTARRGTMTSTLIDLRHHSGPVSPHVRASALTARGGNPTVPKKGREKWHYDSAFNRRRARAPCSLVHATNSNHP